MSTIQNGHTDNNGNGVIARYYSLPRRFLYPEITLFSSIAGLAATAWIPAVYSQMKIGMVLPSALRAAVFLSITAALLLVVVLYAKYELRRVRILLSDDVLVRASPRHIRKIRLVGIESVQLFRLPVNGGIIVVKSGHQTIFLPVVLRHLRDLAGRLELACSDTAIAARVEAATWPEIHRRGILAEKSDKRAARAYRPLLALSFIMIALAEMTGFFFWDLPVVRHMQWTMAAAFVPLAAFATADLLLRLREGRRAGTTVAIDATPAPLDEAKTFTWSGIVVLLLYLIAGIMFKVSVQQ